MGRRPDRNERGGHVPVRSLVAALAAAITLAFAPAAYAHHFAVRSGAELKPRYRACARFDHYQRHARCEIRRAARHYGQPPGAAIRVAFCESSLKWWIVGHHIGMWQWNLTTFRTMTGPYRWRSPLSAKWGSLAAMYMWRRGLRSHWECVRLVLT